ncbi:MAG: hypothetical protein IBX61_04500 [Thermoleophilia bacterium]|nr:hypothetical protein [Thermoleophilia bacterium]
MSPGPAKKQIERLKDIQNKLRSDLERLERDVDSAQRELIEESNRDDRMADVAALAAGRDMDLTMEENARFILKKVDRALKAAE